MGAGQSSVHVEGPSPLAKSSYLDVVRERGNFAGPNRQHDQQRKHSLGPFSSAKPFCRYRLTDLADGSGSGFTWPRRQLRGEGGGIAGVPACQLSGVLEIFALS
jgi:hypothetical protein